ncbi:MAG TPA: type II toxin-antitoxin system VapC family toxin [Stellaceae bacterium]
MTALVLDASIAVTWCFESEATDATRWVLAHLRQNDAAVPTLWPLEVANTLAMAERRGRIVPADAAAFVALLDSLAVAVDAETTNHAFGRILDLARTERLSGYDASYLELAMRLGVPLATKDRALASAASRVGVIVMGMD